MNEIFKEFLTYVAVIVCIYTAQTGFKIASTWKDGTFDWRKLIEGILQYSIYFVSVLVFFFGGSLIPDKQIIPIKDKYLTIVDALTLSAYALIVAQASKMFRNILETFKVKEEDISKQVHARKEA
jgi:hypothetical protein